MHFNTSNVFIYPTTGTPFPYLKSNFNTSNVFIYHNRFPRNYARLNISIHLMFLFIPFLMLCNGFKFHFNTSNVFIYPAVEKGYQDPRWNFNTSNVFIYQFPCSLARQLINISIHLMFLFIGAEMAQTTIAFLFQYI